MALDEVLDEDLHVSEEEIKVLEGLAHKERLHHVPCCRILLIKENNCILLFFTDKLKRKNKLFHIQSVNFINSPNFLHYLCLCIRVQLL